MNHLDTLIVVLLNILTAAFVYGRLTERVKSHDKQIDVLEKTTGRHEGEIGELYGITRRARGPQRGT